MRITTHKRAVSGATTNLHDDRNFDVRAKHIDSELTSRNVCLHVGSQSDSVAVAELKWCQRHFEADLEAHNARCVEQHHPGRCYGSMSDYMANKRHHIQQDIVQIGRHGDTIDEHTAKLIMRDYLEWHKQTYPQVKLLAASLHVDEPSAAPHIHIDSVGVAHHEGLEYPCLKKALEEMGVELPHPDQAEGRYNNRLMTYTADCRANLASIARSYGLDIELEPREASQSGLELKEFKLRELDRELSEKTDSRDEIARSALKARKSVERLEAEVSELESRKTALEELTAPLEAEVHHLEDLKSEVEHMLGLVSEKERLEAVERLEDIKLRYGQYLRPGDLEAVERRDSETLKTLAAESYGAFDDNRSHTLEMLSEAVKAVHRVEVAPRSVEELEEALELSREAMHSRGIRMR